MAVLSQGGVRRRDYTIRTLDAGGFFLPPQATVSDDRCMCASFDCVSSVVTRCSEPASEPMDTKFSRSCTKSTERGRLGPRSGRSKASWTLRPDYQNKHPSRTPDGRARCVAAGSPPINTKSGLWCAYTSQHRQTPCSFFVPIGLQALRSDSKQTGSRAASVDGMLRYPAGKTGDEHEAIGGHRLHLGNRERFVAKQTPA